jgi:hypothetical protein
MRDEVFDSDSSDPEAASRPLCVNARLTDAGTTGPDGIVPALLIDVCAGTGSEGMSVLHLLGLVRSTTGYGGVEKGLKAFLMLF